MAQPVSSRVDTEIATIAAAGSLSGAVDLKGRMLAGIVMPAAWTAASLTFQVSLDNTTFVNLYADQGLSGTSTEYTIATAASYGHSLGGVDWLAWRYVKVRSGTAGTPAAQAAERLVTLSLVDTRG